VSGKGNVVYTHDGVLFSYKEEKFISSSGKWMELEIKTLSETSQYHKDKY
jgi:hypothetical protein